jgi:hypothetical protein
VSQRGTVHPGYAVAGLSRHPGDGPTSAAVDFGGVSLPLSPGPRLIELLEGGVDELAANGRPRSECADAVRRERGYVALAEPHESVLCDMMQDWTMGRDMLVLGPAGAGKSRLGPGPPGAVKRP